MMKDEFHKAIQWYIVGLNTGVIYYQSYDQELCLSLACRLKSEYRASKGKELMIGVI